MHVIVHVVIFFSVMGILVRRPIIRSAALSLLVVHPLLVVLLCVGIFLVIAATIGNARASLLDFLRYVALATLVLYPVNIYVFLRMRRNL